MAGEASGELKKLTVKPFKDPKFNDKAGEDFTVMFNPQQYSVDYKVESDDSQGSGTSGSAPAFKKSRPQKLSMEFTVDGTGATGPKVEVPDKVRAFLETAYEYKGEQHRPPYLMVLWGTLTFKCVLTTCNVTYTLFDSDGTPLRAKLSATFEGFIDDEMRAAEEDKSSPDLTHYRRVNEGDTLPLMCHEIYGDSRYYREVARVNELRNFRELETGSTLYFPPLTK